ncbi:hypothetical protein LR48_Vigan07g124100 [Vigna angularis]|uniref:Uncharacterized protein n=1 Tax=Phaseolus angularis TaxID=3914 RepID=A0A0L9UY82_PHAAN|nr:hypothetical protein LR48_Vigan07g124100 [Vigna angularis]
MSPSAASSSSTWGAGGGQDPHTNDQAGPVGSEDFSRILEDNEDDYDWVPHEVKLYTSSFYTGRSLKELLRSIGMVKAAVDADYFKIVVCKKTE